MVKKKKQQKEELDEIEFSGLPINQLKDHIILLWNAIENEKKIKTSLATERDKMYKYLVLINRDTSNARFKARSMMSKIEETQKQSFLDAIEEKRKFKEAFFEFSGENKGVILDGGTSLMKTSDELWREETLLNEDLIGLKGNEEELKESFNRTYREIGIHHSEIKTNMRDDFFLKRQETNNHWEMAEDESFKDEKQIHLDEIKELNESKEDILKARINANEKDMQELQQVYESITSHNFFLINQLKNQLNSIRNEDLGSDKKFRVALKRNKKLKIETDEMKRKSAAIKERLVKQSKVKSKLSRLKTDLGLTQEDIEEKMLENELALRLLEEKEEVMNETKERLGKSLLNTALNIGRHSLKLAKQIDAVKAVNENYHKLLEIIDSNIDLGNVKVSKCVELEQTMELCRNLKLAHRNMINMYYFIFKKENLNFDDIGFVPKEKL